MPGRDQLSLKWVNFMLSPGLESQPATFHANGEEVPTFSMFPNLPPEFEVTALRMLIYHNICALENKSLSLSTESPFTTVCNFNVFDLTDH